MHLIGLSEYTSTIVGPLKAILVEIILSNFENGIHHIEMD